MTSACLAVVLALSGAADVGAQGERPRPGISGNTFPIGVYSAGNPTDRGFGELKALGIDYVHRYRLASRAQEDVQAYLDMASNKGLKVMLDVSAFLLPKYREEHGLEPSLAAFRECVRQWKDHPALGFWYFYDEPRETTISSDVLLRFHSVLKEETPDVLTAICVCWCERWYRYTGCADIIMPDFYPVRDAEFPRAKLNQQSEFFGRTRARCERMIPVAQCMGFPRYPNPVELRYMMYAALTHGVRGLFFYSYWRSRYKPMAGCELRPSYMRGTFSPVLKELKEFVDRIRPAHEVQRVPNLTDEHYSSRQVLVGVWPRGESAYVVLINNWPEKRVISVPLCPHVMQGTLEPLGSTRSTSTRVEDGALRLDAHPWETFVWQVATDTREPAD